MAAGTWWASVDTAAAITALALSIPSCPCWWPGCGCKRDKLTRRVGIEGRAGLLRLRSARLIPTYPSRPAAWWHVLPVTNLVALTLKVCTKT